MGCYYSIIMQLIFRQASDIASTEVIILVQCEDVKMVHFLGLKTIVV
jgi:hypothetical protein